MDSYWNDNQPIYRQLRDKVVAMILGMIIAGFWQDKKGPRLVGSVGGIFLGVGCLLASMMVQNYTGLVFAYGVLGGLAALMYFYALSLIPAGQATLLNNTFPIWGVLVSLFVLGERPTIPASVFAK